LSQNVTNCPSCQRRTPAARGVCIYCGDSLPFAKIDSAPLQRNIDPADRAYNTILEPFVSSANESVISSLSSALQLEIADVKAMIDARKPLPLARSHTRAEAEMIVALVRTCGARASVIADEEMSLQHELARARRIEIRDDQLHIRHSAGEMAVISSEIVLLVLGELRNRRVDYTEGVSGRRGGSGTVLDSFEYSTEETLLDVYTQNLDTSFRVRSDAFDFSGLVSTLSVQAEKNFREAVSALKTNSPSATLDEDFSRLRSLLERAWPERTHNDSLGIKRTGLAFRAVAQSSVTSSNRDQFNRYSRLMFLSSRRV